MHGNGVDQYCDRFGSFSVEDAYNNRKSGVGDSRAWYDTDSEEIESVVEAARMGYGMRNKESGIRTRAACLMKRSLTRSFLCRACVKQRERVMSWLLFLEMVAMGGLIRRNLFNLILIMLRNQSKQMRRSS